MSLIFSMGKDHARVTGYDGREYLVVIPETVAGKPVTGIAAGAFQGNGDLKTVVVPMGLREIGDRAFRDCRRLSCIGVAESADHSVLPPALRRVGKEAFLRTKLQDVTFTSPVMELAEFCFQESGVRHAWLHEAVEVRFGAGAFMDSDLESISMPRAQIDCLPEYVFGFCLQLQTVHAAAIRVLEEGCFMDCMELRELSAALSLESVGYYAFSGCMELQPRGFFRTIRDAVQGMDEEYWLEKAEELRFSGYGSGPETRRAVRELRSRLRNLMDEIRETEPAETSGLVLLASLGSRYYSPRDGWDFCRRFHLYPRSELVGNFREIPRWNLLRKWEHPALPEAYRSLSELTEQETVQLTTFENTPRAAAVDWEDLTELVNAELGGELARLEPETVAEFLLEVLDCRETGRSAPEIPENRELAEIYRLEYRDSACWEWIHFLKWGVLFDRLCLYEELKSAHLQLCASERRH